MNKNKIMETVYKVSYNGAHCLLFSPEEIPDFINDEILTLEGDLMEIRIEPIQMTEEQINEFEEFDGY